MTRELRKRCCLPLLAGTQQVKPFSLWHEPKRSHAPQPRLHHHAEVDTATVPNSGGHRLKALPVPRRARRRAAGRRGSACRHRDVLRRMRCTRCSRRLVAVSWLVAGPTLIGKATAGWRWRDRMRLCVTFATCRCRDSGEIGAGHFTARSLRLRSLSLQLHCWRTMGCRWRTN